MKEDKINKIDSQTLEEIKSVARLASTSKAIEASKETASMVAHDTMMKITDAINDANQKMARRITIAALVASGVGVLSALIVYLSLASV